MSFIIKQNFRRILAEALFNDINSRRGNYYYFIGKILPWATPLSPDQPEDTSSYEYQTRNGIIAVKKIQPSDFSYVVRRIDWMSGTVYDQYDGDYNSEYLSDTGATSIISSNFYVLTDEFNVYKCLFNNNGAFSTEKPIGTSVLPFVTTDGYKWKYLYTIPLSQRNKFLTEDLMPVQKSVNESYYSNGEIENVIIDSKGSGYLGNSEVTLTVNGEFLGGTGNSIANLVPVFNQAGSIVDVIIRNAGNNYLSANITINDNAGTGTGLYNTSSIANLVPVVYNTKIDRVLINDPGIKYRSNIQTTVVLTGDGTGAELLPFVNEHGELEDIYITSRGEGYTYTDIQIVGDGTGANAFVDLSFGDLDTNQSSVELSAVSGGIHAFRILDRGNNYTSASIVVSGDGVGFVGNVAFTNTNSISHVVVTNPGVGYTYANVVITGDGTGANVEPIFPPQDGHGHDCVRELFANTVVFYSTINNENLHNIDVTNDYRQFGIIKNIKQFSNDRTFANNIGTSAFLVTLNTIKDLTTANLVNDTVLELVGDATRKFEVVEVEEANNRVLLNSLNNYTLTQAESLYEPNTDSTFLITEINNQPSINKFSGDILFIDNRTKVSYSDQQLVTLKTTVRL